MSTTPSTSAPGTSPRAALTIAHIAAVLFGMTGILGALIHFDAITITAGRAGFAAVALFLLALVQKRPIARALNRRQLVVLLASGIFLAAHWITFFLAVKVGGVAVATLGFASFPAFIALLDVLIFRERIGAGETTLLALVTLGLILVTPSFDFGNQGTIGLLWGLLSGLTFACLAILNRRGSRGLDAIQVALWQNAIVLLLVLPMLGMGDPGAATGATRLEGVTAGVEAVATGMEGGASGMEDGAAGVVAASLTDPSRLADWFWLVVLGVFCTGLSHTLFVKSLEGLDARSAGMIIALEPVYAIACAWWLFNEEPSVRMLVGAALIILATILPAQGKKGH